MRRLKLFPVALLFLAAGCSSDETTNGGKDATNPQEKVDLTAFVYDPIDTRTTGNYNGSAIRFYWKKGDKLWVHNVNANPDLIQSTKDDINGQFSGGSGNKTPNASFYFPGIYNKSEYPVRYTGQDNPVGDKITIKATQSQKAPSIGEHLGTDGDCGTAIAKRGLDGKYTFRLEHKAAYLTFMPYYHHEFAEDVKVTQIKVSANEALCGTFDFNDQGIVLSSRPTANTSNKSITLTLNGGGDNGFTIPKSPTASKNAAIMVLAPGDYTGFTVEYTLYDQATKVRGTVKKEYGALSLKEGKNKKVQTDLAIQHYGDDIYYMWDAPVGNHYWKGHENEKPILNDNLGTNFPTAQGDPRWFNNIEFPAHATRSAKDCPNANELRWIAEKGDPHWDPSLWSVMKHLYAGGMWLKKLNVIAAENGGSNKLKSHAPDGTDFVNNLQTDFVKFVYSNTQIKSGKPAVESKYIFLPTLGYFREGKLAFVGIKGYFWASTPRKTGNITIQQAYNMSVHKDEVHTGYGDRINAHVQWSIF